MLDKARLILKATRQHARNLAAFAATYKAIILTLRSISSTRKEESSHAFLAGLVGGYLVFGRGIQSSVNQQIVIYVFARAVLSMAKLMMQIHHSTGTVAQYKTTVSKNAWPVFAGLSWATIMWMFRWHPQTIQPSLRSSMKYMYVILRIFFQEKNNQRSILQVRRSSATPRQTNTLLAMSTQIIGIAFVIFWYSIREAAYLH